MFSSAVSLMGTFAIELEASSVDIPSERGEVGLGIRCFTKSSCTSADSDADGGVRERAFDRADLIRPFCAAKVMYVS